MAIDLTNRVCVITGCAEGIGAALATGFTARGATVVATDIKPPVLPSVAMSLAWDVTDPAAATRVMDAVVARFGRVDAFVANAGIYPRHPWDEITPEDWRKSQAVNLEGSWWGCQAAAKVMVPRGYGKIVTVSSITVRMGTGNLTPYIAAKAGIIGMTQSLARAVGAQGVRVNCVMPGAILTDAEVRLFPDQETVLKKVNEAQAIPGRIGPEAIEPTFAFLCAVESDAITGQVIAVDQGMTAG
ncbi:MAG: SDR family oxidoreductase [Planctomycetes bacterium]|nr:SDR family oxidoreductase [Planctomycetota bacterium]